MPGNDQTAAWTQIRRFNSDWILRRNLSNTHVVALRKMKRNGTPITRYISVNWLNEVGINNIAPKTPKVFSETRMSLAGKTAI